MEWIVEADSIKDVMNGHMVCFKRFIRCKDCYWWSKDQFSRDDMRWCYEHGRYMPENFFCARGERNHDDV